MTVEIAATQRGFASWRAIEEFVHAANGNSVALLILFDVYGAPQRRGPAQMQCRLFVGSETRKQVSRDRI